MNIFGMARILGGGMALAALAQAETVYFVCSGRALSPSPPEAYVVPVSDPAKIAQARAFLRGGPTTLSLIARVRIAAEGDGINRNYADPRRPAWDWRVVELLEWSSFDPRGVRTADYVLNRDGAPSDVPRILRGEGGPRPVDPVTGAPVTIPADTMALREYSVQMELVPAKPAAVLNVSQRGYVAGGERVLIVGFVVDGGAPRNLVVRALGPSLAAFGVKEPLADPKLAVYRGAEKVQENDDWAAGSLGRPHLAMVPPPSPFHLVPPNAKEPAIELSLAPGAYTVVVTGADGGSGVALVEVYDLDAGR